TDPGPPTVVASNPLVSSVAGPPRNRLFWVVQFPPSDRPPRAIPLTVTRVGWVGLRYTDGLVPRSASEANCSRTLLKLVGPDPVTVVSPELVLVAERMTSD